MTQRIIFIGEGIDSDVANIVCAQLNYLDNIDSTDSPIHIYINSPGGYVTDTLAIYDTMQYVKNPVHTLCIGQAASGAALLLLAGTKGCRKALPHAEIMLHQPSGGMMGKVSDVQRHAERMKSQKAECNAIVSKHTKLSIQEAEKLLEWDTFLNASESLEHGIIDSIITHKKQQRLV
jgi:ATP-dependent Clp protease protease subunit